jgi:hypothetical protein
MIVTVPNATGALLQHIDTVDCPIESVFKRVRNAVAAETNGKQITWEHTSLAGDFYFNTSACYLRVRLFYPY